MASKVLSIEIGYSLTKVLEIDYQVKNPKVYSSFVLETPSDLFRDDIITDHAIFSEAMRIKLTEHNIKTKNVVFTISSNKIATREVPVPASIKENRIQSLIEMNAKDYFPIDLSDYKLSFTPLREVREGADLKKYLLVLAAPKALLDSYIRFGHTCGLETVALDYNGNSLFQAIKDSMDEEGNKMVIKVDEKSAFCMVMHGKNIVFTRNIAYGIDDAIEAIIENRNFDANTYLDAIDMVRAKTCIYSSYNTPESGKGDGKRTGDATSDTQAMWDAKCEVTKAFSSLTGGIGRVIDFYKSKNPNDPLTNIYLTGIGADFSGLQKLIAGETGIECKVFTEFNNIRFDNRTKELPLGEYITCIGATISPVGFYVKEGSNRKAQVKGRDYMAASILFLILCLLCSVALVMFAKMEQMDEQAKKKTLERNIATYEPAYDTYRDYVITKYTYSKLKHYNEALDSHGNHIVEFINEMEQKMPTTLRVQSFNATEDGVALSITVDSMEAAAKLIEQFETFDTVATVEVSSLSITKNDVGEGVVSFSINIIYKALTMGQAD